MCRQGRQDGRRQGETAIIVISVFAAFFLLLVGCLGLGALMFESFNADDDVPAVSTN
jgi:hypothetical protein